MSNEEVFMTRDKCFLKGTFQIKMICGKFVRNMEPLLVAQTSSMNLMLWMLESSLYLGWPIMGLQHHC
ncbi:Uncharacterized protein TCM_032476 [Theobroma cacao]|uniref:Uncharacterized protein n=1 Tax=Theobroma cacao TaxID=3641 RepID=A0A061F9W1_THECC|nr:Uncharacterized protein TCM_032476 [Theobroma cacao]